MAGSGQEVDLTLPANCNGYGRVRHLRLATAEGWPTNPLPIVPACRARNRTSAGDDDGARVPEGSLRLALLVLLRTEELLKADHSRSAWFTSDELIDFYREIPDAPRIIDLSGGSPDLVPEWTPWMMRALTNASLAETTYLWTDDNLSTTYLFEALALADLVLLRSYRNYGRVCCVKGFDARSLAAAAHACRPGGVVQISLPPDGARPGAEADRQAAIAFGRRLGLAVIEHRPLAIGYETPSFERNALAAAGFIHLRIGAVATLLISERRAHRQGRRLPPRHAVVTGPRLASAACGYSSVGCRGAFR
jgi:hypothetical protein